MPAKASRTAERVSDDRRINLRMRALGFRSRQVATAPRTLHPSTCSQS